MADEAEVTGVDLGRWVVIGVIIACCLGLYLWLAPRTPPAVDAIQVETAP